MSSGTVPLYPEAFVGWRGWHIENGRLMSVATQGFVWEPGEQVVAHCGRHKAPRQGCTCGLYSTKSLRKLIENGYHDHGAFGQVSLWGRIIDYDDGYRSEFAYPKVIYLSYLNMRHVEALSVYGVPVMLKNPHKVAKKGGRIK